LNQRAGHSIDGRIREYVRPLGGFARCHHHRPKRIFRDGTGSLSNNPALDVIFFIASLPKVLVMRTLSSHASAAVIRHVTVLAKLRFSLPAVPLPQAYDE